MIPEKIQAARYKIAQDYAPYLSTILWSLVPVEVKDLAKMTLGPIGVDKWHRMYYDPDVVDKWEVKHLATILMHETHHFVRRHMERFKPPCNHVIANIAEDIIINEGLRNENREFPSIGCVFAETFKLPKGKVEEWYYEELMKQAEKNGKKAKGVAGGNCGSCTGGNKREWEQGAPDGGNAEGIDEVEGELLVNQTMKEISRSQGNVPGDLKQMAEEWFKPKVNWRQQLGRFLRGSLADLSGMVDYTYKRPSRRQAGTNILLPVLRRPRPNVAIVGDTSGSMWDQEQFGVVLGETEGILRACGMKEGVPFYSTDAEVQSKNRIFSPRQVQLKGGGGTDMRVGIEEALKGKPRPEVVVVLTDCMTPWPMSPLRKTKMIVVGINAPEESIKEVPEWAGFVRVETKG
jgi:predicted metal-dependent peptidase